MACPKPTSVTATAARQMKERGFRPPGQSPLRKLRVARPTITITKGGGTCKTNAAGSNSDMSTSRTHQRTRLVENTYKTDPEEDGRFVTHQAEYVISHVLEAHLRKKKYDAEQCSRLSKDLCCIIKTKIKDLNFYRYKLVVQVMIGQNTDHTVQVASRCLWNADTDTFAAATYRNDSLYAIGTVFGLYAE